MENSTRPAGFAAVGTGKNFDPQPVVECVFGVLNVFLY